MEQPTRSDSLSVRAPRDVADSSIVSEDAHESRLGRIGLHDPSPAIEIEIGRIQTDPSPPETDYREGCERNS